MRIELASHRWRGGHASAVAETRRNMIHALVEATGAVLSWASRRLSKIGTGPCTRRDPAWTKLRETLRGSRKLVHKSTIVT